MELLQLKYFCDAAETENFSATAKKYLVPTSDISQTIKRLEKELDTELFIRKPNKIKLNESGKEFYKGIKAALLEIENTKNKVAACKELIRGEIKILALTNRRIVTKTIEVFKSKYPEVSFVLSHNHIAEDDFDIIISDTSFDERKYEKTELINEKILLAINTSHRLAKNKTIKADDLRNERFITMPSGRSLNMITRTICNHAGFEPEIVIQSDDPYYIRKYVEMGLGVAFVPEYSWKGQFLESVILKSVGDIQRRTFIYVRNDKFVNKSIKVFCETMLSISELKEQE